MERCGIEARSEGLSSPGLPRLVGGQSRWLPVEREANIARIAKSLFLCFAVLFLLGVLLVLAACSEVKDYAAKVECGRIRRWHRNRYQKSRI